MVIVWIHLLLLLPFFLLSAEFTAHISRNEVSVGESFKLDLTLKDASAKTHPSVEPLRQFFVIHSQHQSFNTKIINGKVSSSFIWTYVLVPSKAGEVQIPSIGVETSEGKFFTQPIAMRITQEKKSKPVEETRLETEASNQAPYKNEPFFFTVRLISKQTLTNLQAQKFEIEDSIVELAGDSTVGEEVENGMRVGVVEFKFLVTPLKSGPLKIPSIAVQGEIPQRRNSRSYFDSKSLFDDNYDPFSMIQGFVNLQPFVMSTGEMVVNVRPPVAGLVPWLPARALEIRENWDSSQTFQESEVFTRSFVIAAEGIHSSQLPSLEGKLDNDGRFKVYADKPELRDEMVDGKLKSYRSEQYTLIPQKSGELTLPEISVGWWDAEKAEKRVAQIPARSVQVLPASSMTVNTTISEMDERKPVTEETLNVATHPFMYVLIGTLSILLTVVLALLVLLLRKLKRLQELPTKKKNIISKEPKTRRKWSMGKLVPLAIKRGPFSQRKRERLDDLNPT